jgi:hypothetical protein
MTSGVTSAYRSAALFESYQQRVGFPEGVRGRKSDADRFSTHDLHLPNLKRKPPL